MEERNLDLVARNEETRDKFHTEVIRFELDQILQHFVEAIQSINAQFDVADELVEFGKVIEGENIWQNTVCAKFIMKIGIVQISMRIFK